MSRYVIIQPTGSEHRTEWDGEQPAPALPHPQIFVPEPVKTGLLDSSGREIYRVPDEIGFLRRSR